MLQDFSSSPPSISKTIYDNSNDEIASLNLKNEEADIARLQLPKVESKDIKEENESLADDRIPKIKFRCSVCGMYELVHYLGKTPPFVYGIKFLEDTFVLRDPFQPPPPRWKAKAEFFVALGSPCTKCEAIVCRDAECSFFYTRTYCLTCAQKTVERFPTEAQAKLRRQIAAKK